MSIGIRIQNTMEYCKLAAGCVGGAGLAVAYQMGAIGLALTAIGGIGCLWAIASSRNTSGERDLNNGRIVSNNREQIAAQASGLIHPDMDAPMRNAIIETVARIPAHDRKQVIDLALSFLPPAGTLFSSDRYNIIKTVASIPANNREQVMNLAFRLINTETSITVRRLIIQTLARTPANEHEQVMNLALQITRIDDPSTPFIIQIVASTPANEREQVMDFASRLIHPQMPSIEMYFIIKAVASIPANERVQFINLASRLFTQDRANFGITIATFARIPANERVQFINLVSPLIHPQMPSIATYSIIESVASIPVNEREQAITLAFRLINQETDALDRSRIIARVARAGNEREARVQRVLHQIPQDLANGLENEAILYRMLVILETPLNPPIPPFRAGMAELAHAIDVHHGSRDAKTREAIELLRKHQGLLNPTRISAAVEEFKQYLNAYAGDSAIKNTAQQALHGPPENEDWAPLLNNAIYTIDNGRLSISGEELIARLWIFANEQSEKKEQENCRFGIIKALSDSIEHGRRVCPPGQTQRQVVAVLQGRLKGVNVDGVRKTTNELVAGLIVENKGAGRAQLIQAAGVFLDRNPDVDRDAFMIELNEYMRLMEL